MIETGPDDDHSVLRRHVTQPSRTAGAFTTSGTRRLGKIMIKLASAPRTRPSLGQALMRGLRRSCPHCGEGAAFSGYLKVADQCGHCGAELGKVRADDAPPYFTIVIVGHIIVPLMMAAEKFYAISILTHSLIWLPLTAVLTLAFLPYIKGATLGLMASLGINGTETSENPHA